MLAKLLNMNEGLFEQVKKDIEPIRFGLISGRVARLAIGDFPFPDGRPGVRVVEDHNGRRLSLDSYFPNDIHSRMEVDVSWGYLGQFDNPHVSALRTKDSTNEVGIVIEFSRMTFNSPIPVNENRLPLSAVEKATKDAEDFIRKFIS